MHFIDFKLFIKELKNKPLGGFDAQFKMAPALRLRYDKKKIMANRPRRAGVMSLFYPDDSNNTQILLTKRASYKGTHSAQISFPGGKVEEKDASLEETALRETFEEVGVPQNNIQTIRKMTTVYIPPSNFLVTPFLGFSNQRLNFLTNREVEEVIELPLKDLLDDSNLDEIYIKTMYMEKTKVPCFKFGNHVVWGATGMMLNEIKEMFKN